MANWNSDKQQDLSSTKMSSLRSKHADFQKIISSMCVQQLPQNNPKPCSRLVCAINKNLTIETGYEYVHIWCIILSVFPYLECSFSRRFSQRTSLFVFVRHFRWKIQAVAAVGWKDMERKSTSFSEWTINLLMMLKKGSVDLKF